MFTKETRRESRCLKMSTDREIEEELKRRVADKYTAMELVELLDIPVEEILELYWDRIPDFILEELR